MPMPRLIRHGRSRVGLTLALMVLAATALAAHRWPRPDTAPQTPLWREAAWRMPLDNWGEEIGRASCRERVCLAV